MLDLEWLACALLRRRRIFTIWNVSANAGALLLTNPAFDYSEVP